MGGDLPPEGEVLIKFSWKRLVGVIIGIYLFGVFIALSGVLPEEPQPIDRVAEIWDRCWETNIMSQKAEDDLHRIARQEFGVDVREYYYPDEDNRCDANIDVVAEVNLEYIEESSENN